MSHTSFNGMYAKCRKNKCRKEKCRKKKVESKKSKWKMSKWKMSKMKNVERKKCRINRKSCLMLIMKYLFDFNEKKEKYVYYKWQIARKNDSKRLSGFHQDKNYFFFPVSNDKMSNNCSWGYEGGCGCGWVGGEGEGRWWWWGEEGWQENIFTILTLIPAPTSTFLCLSDILEYSFIQVYWRKSVSYSTKRF